MKNKMKILAALALALLLACCAALAEVESDYTYFPESEAYLGQWINGDYSLEITHSDKDPNLFLCVVTHTLAEDAYETWVYDGCAYDDIGAGLSCEMIGVRTEVRVTGDGTEEKVIFDDGATTFSLNDDGDMLWTDFKVAPGEGDIVFEKVEASAGEGLRSSDQEAIDSPEWVKNLPAAQDEDTRQLFVVAGLGMDKTTAAISMHVRAEDGSWKQILSTPGFVGKNGLCLDADHAEGCGQTPIGTYGFNAAFGIAADPGCAIPYFQVDEDTYWSGDESEHYNEMVDIKDYPGLDMTNSEHIMDYDFQYQYCLNISFNDDGTPGRGSAIFLHCLGPIKPYTGGCVAIPENIMRLVMRNVQPDCVVVIDTLENMGGSF